MNSVLVPVAQAARLLTASEGTIANWLDQGLLREWARGPKRRIVDVKEALLLCGLRHDLHQITPSVVRALGLDLEGTADLDVAARLAQTFAHASGLPPNKLEASVARYLGLGYTAAEIVGCLERIAAYRARAQRSAAPALASRTRSTTAATAAPTPSTGTRVPPSNGSVAAAS